MSDEESISHRGSASDQTLEGWFTDPYGRHELRWLSDGRATKLVRDGETTSYDDPPPGPWAERPQRAEVDADAGAGGRDLVRADAAEADYEPYDPQKARWAVYDQLAAQPPSAFDDAASERHPDG